MSPSSLSFTRVELSQCGQVNYVVNNGTAPFQVEIVPEARRQRTLYFATNKFGFVLDLPAGQYFFIAITDAGGNSGVDGMLTVGSSSDNSCLNAATTPSVGMATSMYPGIGVVLPTSTSITGSISSSAISQGAVPPGVEGGQSASPDSSGTKRSITPIIAGAVGAVAVAVMLSLLLIPLVHHLKNKRRRPNPAEGGATDQENQKAEGDNPVIPVPQHPPATVPEIYTEEPHVRMVGYSVEPFDLSTRQGCPSNDSYTHSTYYSNVTTHAPRPQPYISGETAAFDDDPSTNQQRTSTTSHFSQSTNMNTSAYPCAEDVEKHSDVSQNTLRFGDRKGGLASPGLPPGAMPPSPTPGINSVNFSIPLQNDPPGTPGSSNFHSRFSSPPPRSETGTVLPPYNEV